MTKSELLKILLVCSLSSAGNIAFASQLFTQIKNGENTTNITQSAQNDAPSSNSSIQTIYMPNINSFDDNSYAQWMPKVKVGDTIKRDQIIMEAEGAKVAMEVPWYARNLKAHTTATVLEFLRNPGEAVPPGTPLIKIQINNPEK